MAPEVSLDKNASTLSIAWKEKDKNAFRWIVYFQYADKWEYKIFPRNENKFEIDLKATDSAGKENNLKRIVVTSVDRLGNESLQNIISIG